MFELKPGFGEQRAQYKFILLAKCCKILHIAQYKSIFCNLNNIKLFFCKILQIIATHIMWAVYGVDWLMFIGIE